MQSILELEEDCNSSSSTFEDPSASITFQNQDEEVFFTKHDTRYKNTPFATPDADARSDSDAKRRILSLLSQNHNEYCVDCQSPYPRWISIINPNHNDPDHKTDAVPMGCFCCTECAGPHRKLGTHVTFVRSVDHDSFKDHEATAAEAGGNTRVNRIYEALHGGGGGGEVKPTGGSSGEERERFVAAKYGERRWYRPPSVPSPAGSLRPSSLAERNFDPTDKPEFYRSIELVRNTSVLCDDYDGDGGTETADGDGPSPLPPTSTDEDRPRSVFDQQAPFTHNMRRMYESFVGREGDDDTESECEGELGKGEGFGGEDGNASEASEDSSVWHVAEDDERGLSEIVSL